MLVEPHVARDDAAPSFLRPLQSKVFSPPGAVRLLPRPWCGGAQAYVGGQVTAGGRGVAVPQEAPQEEEVFDLSILQALAAAGTVGSRPLFRRPGGSSPTCCLRCLRCHPTGLPAAGAAVFTCLHLAACPLGTSGASLTRMGSVELPSSRLRCGMLRLDVNLVRAGALQKFLLSIIPLVRGQDAGATGSLGFRQHAR